MEHDHAIHARLRGRLTPKRVPQPNRSDSTGDAFLEEIVERLTRRGGLTRRMSQALELHIRGWPRAAAAQQMNCSLNTYRNHIASAFRRIGAEAPNELLRVIALDLDDDPRGLLGRLPSTMDLSRSR